MKRINKNDEVIVISGRYKGAIGKVLKVLLKEDRVIVENVNKVKKSLKNQGEGMNFQEKEAPIHLSNVSLFSKKRNKAIKVSYVIGKDNKKIKVDRKTKEIISDKK